MSSIKTKLFILGTLSLLLIISAFLNISSSYSIPKKDKEFPIWNVYLKSEDKEEIKDLFVSTYGVVVEFKLDDFSSSKSYNLSINNTGSIDALISNINISGLDEIVGKSQITNKTYFLKDYIDVSLKYSSDDNGILKEETLKIKDKILSRSKNKFAIVISRKNEKELSVDALYVLNKNKQVVENKIPLEGKIKINIDFKEE